MTGQYVLRGDLVINVVVADPTGQWQPPEGTTVMDIPDGFTAGIGWRLVDGDWIAPPPPVEPSDDIDPLQYNVI
jgi:hypothetical protein